MSDKPPTVTLNAAWAWVRLRMEIAGTVALALGSLAWLGQARVIEVLTDLLDYEIQSIVREEIALSRPDESVCTVIPADGHYVQNGLPGEWVTVTWRNVYRYRDDCGQPTLVAEVRNGGRTRHTAELSIVGLPLGVGAHDLTYRFKIPETATPGPSTFKVYAVFTQVPGRPQTAESPQWPFEIFEPATQPQ